MTPLLSNEVPILTTHTKMSSDIPPIKKPRASPTDNTARSMNRLSRAMMAIATLLIGVVASFVFYQFLDRSNQSNLRELVTRDVLLMGERLNDRTAYVGRDILALGEALSKDSGRSETLERFTINASRIMEEMAPCSALLLMRNDSDQDSPQMELFDVVGDESFTAVISDEWLSTIRSRINLQPRGFLAGGVLEDVPIEGKKIAHVIWYGARSETANGDEILVLAFSEVTSLVDFSLSKQLSMSYDVLVGKSREDGSHRLLTYRTANFRETPELPTYEDLRGRPTQQYMLQVGNDSISILFNPTVVWIDKHQSPLPSFLFVLALTVTTLVAILLIVLARRTAVIETAVTKRTQDLAESQRQLSLRNNTLNSVLNRSPDLMILQDADGKIIYANPKSLKILSIDVAEDLIGILPSEIAASSKGLTSHVMKTIAIGFSQIKAGEAPQPTKLHVIDAALNSQTYLHIVQVPIRDREGKIIRCLTVARDTTEEHLRVAAITKANHQIETLVKKTATAIIEWDAHKKIVSWNPAAERVFGYTASQAIGRGVDVILPTSSAKDPQSSQKSPLDHLDTGVTAPFTSMTANNREVVCEWQNTSITDEKGSLTGITSFVQDVTRRILAENSMQERSRVLANLAKSSVGFLRGDDWTQEAGALLCALINEESVFRAGIFEQSDETETPQYETIVACEKLDGAAIIVDPAKGEQLSETTESLVHRSWLDQLRSHEEISGDIDQFDSRAKDLLHSEAINSILILPVFVESQLWGFIRFDNNDELRPWSADQVDALRVVGAVLSTAINKQALDAKQTGLERRLLLAQKRESLGLLASGVADNFRSLVDEILGSASLARTQVDSDTTVDDCLGSIETAGLRATELCREMLLYSGHSGNEIGLVSVNLILRGAINQLRHTISDSIQIVTDFANGLPVIEGDANQLRQAVYNILLNSTESMESGAGLIRIQTGLAKPTQRTGPIGSDDESALQRVFIRITDTGRGIDERSLEHIFDPFFSTKEHGRGLGLTLVQSAIEAHGGFIRVKSELDHGTVVNIQMPCRNQKEVKTTTARQSPILQLSGTILYAEADHEQCERGKAILKKFGLKVETVSDGKEAVDRVTRNPGRYLFVCLDIKLPVMDGLSALTKILKLPQDQRILLTSTRSVTSETQRLVDEGLAVTIAKPIDEGELSGAIRELLDRHPTKRSDSH